MQDEKLVRQIGDELLGRVNAPEQEVYRAVREIILPIIAREVAAQKERDAVIAESMGADRIERNQDGSLRSYDMQSREGRCDATLNAMRVRAQTIAAAIRSAG